jgi:uncharacterized oxidoreductase
VPTFDAARLQTFATELLATRATAEESKRVAVGLVNANLRGYDSHGVMRLPYYLKAVADGEVISGAELTITKESATHLVTDANWGFGQVQAGRLLDRLIEKTGTAGMAIGTMIQAGHIGRLGEYCEASAEENLVSIVMVNSHGAVVRVAPPGGKAPRLSTNPLAIGVPQKERPLILDFSTSAAAEGKVRVKKIAGEKCPPGWLLDNEGLPTTDPETLYGEPPGSILPMGGGQAYKGFGLSLMIEILTGALSGGRTSREPLYPKKGNCVFMLLVDPEHFGGRDHFAAEVEQLIEYVCSSPCVEGCEAITLPGDPERKTLAQRLPNGIFLDDENWAVLARLAAGVEVAVPDAVTR